MITDWGLRRFGGIGPRGAAGLIVILVSLPILIVFVSLLGPFRTDAVQNFSGMQFGDERKLIAGEPTIEPNYGVTAQALGTRAALEIWSGRLPLWNHYQGFGAPLLGEMQSAALFPPTWLMRLPHGQILEQALLQFIAGFGTFLFLRSYGMRNSAALTGALLFEVNGIYGWLRNAIFNPVAFLPWLFLIVEHLQDNVIGGLTWRRRFPTAAFGACVAALSLYAGFPEQVYLYGLLLVVWTAVRMRRLSLAQNIRFATDLLLAGLLAILLCAPQIVAFVDYLKVAELGGHTNGGFGAMWIEAGGLLQYIAPYVYGPIFAGTNPVVSDIWSSTGGYIGFAPILIAIGGLFTPGRRVEKVVLATWITVALAVSHGLPIVHQLFMLIPLAATAATFRYLNASWIFCFVILSAGMLDDIPGLAIRVVRQILLTSLVAAFVVLAMAIAAAWPLISDLAAAPSSFAPYVAFSAVAVILVTVAVLTAMWVQSPQRSAAILSATLFCEAMAWFAFPYLSYPRAGKLDLDLIAFLENNIGYARVLNSRQAALGPNYGSYFGVPLLDYDDLPSPKLTARFIKATLDPYANAIGYGPWPEGLSSEQQADWNTVFLSRLPAYAQAGVKYVLGGPEFGKLIPFVITSDEAPAYRVAPGQHIDVVLHSLSPESAAVSRVSVMLDPEDRATSGTLAAIFCKGTDCASGTVDLGPAETRKLQSIALDHRVVIGPGAEYVIHLAWSGGTEDLALPAFRLASPDLRSSVAVADTVMSEGFVPDIRLADGSLTLVHAGLAASVYQLSGTRDYFTAKGCELKPRSHDSVEATCAAPSRLTRLELAMEGWSASIDGTPTTIGIAEDIFQTVSVPAGRSRIIFSFTPRWFYHSLVAAALALLVVVFAVVDRRRWRTRPSAIKALKTGNRGLSTAAPP